ncbi:MBL fold metallo-hydrolase [Vibrio hannami]|uniref:MBL fold metallo-hydrolase n=1 Tax=Vibrio hannami TaxID=2717094 RepID=UPI003BB02367
MSFGSGSAYAKNSNTSSVLISGQSGHQLLIDCGPTIPRALLKKEVGVNDIDAIFFTHIHPDHCAGISALLNNWKSFGRTQTTHYFLSKRTTKLSGVPDLFCQLASNHLMF